MWKCSWSFGNITATEWFVHLTGSVKWWWQDRLLKRQYFWHDRICCVRVTAVDSLFSWLTFQLVIIRLTSLLEYPPPTYKWADFSLKPQVGDCSCNPDYLSGGKCLRWWWTWAESNLHASHSRFCYYCRWHSVWPLLCVRTVCNHCLFNSTFKWQFCLSRSSHTQ